MEFETYNENIHKKMKLSRLVETCSKINMEGFAQISKWSGVIVNKNYFDLIKIKTLYIKCVECNLNNT